MRLPSPIRSKVPSKEYKENFDKIFGKQPTKSQAKRIAVQKKKEPK